MKKYWRINIWVVKNQKNKDIDRLKKSFSDSKSATCYRCTFYLSGQSRVLH